MPKFFHYGIGVLLKICYIFSEHFLIRTPVNTCFWLSKFNEPSLNLRYRDLPKQIHTTMPKNFSGCNLSAIYFFNVSILNVTWNMTLRNLKPTTWYLKPGTWQLLPDTWDLAIGTWHIEPGTWHLEPGTCFSNLPLF